MSDGLTDLLASQLDTLALAMPPSLSVAQWYDDGADVAVFTTPGANTSGLYAWGYIVGAADALDVTVLTLLDQEGLSFPSESTEIRESRARTFVEWADDPEAEICPPPGFAVDFDRVTNVGGRNRAPLKRTRHPKRSS